MPGERILVVEDEVALGDLIAEGLRRHGYLVERAQDGDTALDMTETLVPDLLLLDLMLPGMDGWEICRRIRQYRKTRDIAHSHAHRPTGRAGRGGGAGAWGGTIT